MVLKVQTVHKVHCTFGGTKVEILVHKVKMLSFFFFLEGGLLGSVCQSFLVPNTFLVRYLKKFFFSEFIKSRRFGTQSFGSGTVTGTAHKALIQSIN